METGNLSRCFCDKSVKLSHTCEYDFHNHALFICNRVCGRLRATHKALLEKKTRNYGDAMHVHGELSCLCQLEISEEQKPPLSAF